MNTILVCCTSSRDRDLWIGRAQLSGARILRPPTNSYIAATFERLELELRFEILESSHDTERLLGLELAGVLNLAAVSDQACRSMIYARIRP